MKRFFKYVLRQPPLSWIAPLALALAATNYSSGALGCSPGLSWLLGVGVGVGLSVVLLLVYFVLGVPRRVDPVTRDLAERLMKDFSERLSGIILSADYPSQALRYAQG